MAAAFAELPCKVLWRLTSSEIPDASASFRLGRTLTKVRTPATPICAYHVSESAAVGQATSEQTAAIQRNAFEPTA